MTSNVRDSMATTAIRVVKDTARLTAKQASLKTLQLTSLFNADLATGKKAYAMSFSRESFPDLFHSVDNLDGEIERKRAAEPTDAHETTVDRTKRIARECKKRLDVERLLHKRKKLLAKIGHSLRDSDLASAEAIKDEITYAREIGAKESALGQEIAELSARQPRWMRPKIILALVVAAVISSLLLIASTRPSQAPLSSPTPPTLTEKPSGFAPPGTVPRPPAGLGKSMADVRAKLIPENGWKWTSEPMTDGSGGKSFRGTNSTMPWVSVQLVGTDDELGRAVIYIPMEYNADSYIDFPEKSLTAIDMGGYFHDMERKDYGDWFRKALRDAMRSAKKGGVNEPIELRHGHFTSSV